VLQAAEDFGVDPEEGFEDEEEAPSHVVVSPYYKQKYAENGHPDHCGDWLAKRLEGEFEVVVDSRIVFDHDEFARMMVENGIDLSGKWANLPASGKRGWQGRYRMNGRQKLEKVLARTGELKLKGTTVKLPRSYLSELRARHPVDDARSNAKAD
jgi:hypothetical protein